MEGKPPSPGLSARATAFTPVASPLQCPGLRGGVRTEAWPMGRIPLHSTPLLERGGTKPARRPENRWFISFHNVR